MLFCQKQLYKAKASQICKKNVSMNLLENMLKRGLLGWRRVWENLQKCLKACIARMQATAETPTPRSFLRQENKSKYCARSKD